MGPSMMPLTLRLRWWQLDFADWRRSCVHILALASSCVRTEPLIHSNSFSRWSVYFSLFFASKSADNVLECTQW